jgi:hypothetical protein
LRSTSAVTQANLLELAQTLNGLASMHVREEDADAMCSGAVFTEGTAA